MAGSSELEDMGDFMEMVTVYRCKFCVFSASTAQAMCAHVKQTHVKSIQKAPGTKPVQDFRSDQLNTPEFSTASPLDNQLSTLTSGPQQSVSVITGQIPEIEPDTVNKTEPEPPTLLTIDALSSVIQQSDLCLQNGHNKQSQVIQEPENQLLELATSTGTQQEVYNKLMVNPIATSVPNASLLPAENSMAVLSTSECSSLLSDQLQSVTDAQALGNIHFVNEDSQGQLVRLGDGSTVQVLVYDSNITQSISTPSGDVISVDEGNVAVDTETQTLKDQETNQIVEDTNLHFVVDGEDGVYTEQQQSKVKPDERQNPEGFREGSAQGQEGEEGEGLTKELYLCGSCCEGFSTINECKVHMIQDHGLTEAPVSGRVDAGTQMEPKKKAGRKKKSEKVQEEKEEELPEIIISDSDEDWSEQLSTYSTRSQRKRRPPSSLRKDYYLGRRKQKTPKKRLDAGMNIRCDEPGCVARFRTEDTKKLHMECHIEGAADNDPQFRCTACEEKFFMWKQARYHMWRVHKIDIDLFTCEYCNTFKTDTLSKLKIHCEIHGTDRPYHCEICGKGFKQFAQMKNHEHCHTDNSHGVDSADADKWHTPKVCDVCGRTFANTKCLKKHKETVHSDYKPFKCMYCSHTCSRKAMLILHQRVHTGEKPFSCNLCSYTCGDHNSLRRHKMRHSGQKPYKCPHCPYASIQAISLKVHIKNKHPGMGGVFNCHLCLYRTVNKVQYENHLLDHKNGLIETLVAPDGQIMYKNVSHSRKPKARAIKSEVAAVALQPDLLESLQTQTVQMQNILQPQVIQVPVSTVNNTEQVAQLEVQMNEVGENVISTEDLAKLTNYEGAVHSDVQAAQLIYSALSAISQNAGGTQDVATQGLVAGVENGDVQTSIQTNSEEGVTTHTITFHLQEAEEMEGGTQLQGDSGNKNVRILKFDDVANTWPANAVLLDQAEVQNT